MKFLTPTGWWLALATSGMLAICACNRRAEVPPGDPAKMSMQHADCNIVFVSFDALQAAHVGCLGYSRDVTPTLDTFAANSFAFSHCSSASSWTVPASMTWFTGVYPSEHGMTNKFAVYSSTTKKIATLRDKSPSLQTLAQILRDNGYATAGFCGNAGVSKAFGFDQGFDVYEHETDRFGGFDQSVPKAISWLQANQHRKFFLFLHGYDVHGQCLPPTGLDYRFVERDYDRKFIGSPQEQEVLREEGLDHGELTLRDADVRFWRAVYDEKIQRADARFREFLTAFDKLHLSDKTLFIITSDHGTEFYEHRRFDHGFTLYNEQTHVPLFIKLPGQRGSQINLQRVSSIDILPTILDLAQIKPDQEIQPLRGQSLASIMQGESTTRDVFIETDYRQYTYKRAIITPQGKKLIYTLESKQRELFDLLSDPDELQNLAAAQPALADELEAKLFAHYASIGHDLRSQSWQPGFNPVYNFTAPAKTP